MKTCRECKEKLEMLQKSMLTAEDEQHQIQYMKKVKTYYIRKNMICFFLLAGVIVAGMLMVLHQYGTIPRTVYYVVSPLLIAASYIVLPRCEEKDVRMAENGQDGKEQSGQPRHGHIRIMTGLELFMMLYIMMLGGLCVYWSESGNYLSFIPVEQLGPVLYWQLMAIVFLLIGIFIFAGISLFKEKDVNMLIFNLAITGICMALGFISILKMLDRPENFGGMIMKTFGIILVEGAIMHIVQQIKEKVNWSI